jgi:hypothetical protein
VTVDARDDVRYAVLNAVALKKMATAPAVAAASGVSPDTARAVLTLLADDGLIVAVGEQVLPTDSAEPALAQAAAQRYAALRADPAIVDLHGDFERINRRFLAAMASWQQVDVAGQKLPNTHDDPAYDDRVLTTIERLVERLRGIIDQLVRREPRFATYGARLGRATGKALAGQIDAVSSPTTDSIHNVWFEFHEDLLRTLGIERKE